MSLLTTEPVLAKNQEIKEFLLDNGLKVIILEDHSSPTATFQVWYKVGARNEVTGRTGISHLLEHMMFKGTQQHGKGEFSRIIARNGGNENAFTGKDYTAYFERFSSDRLALSVELESDRMANLLLDEREFQLERDVVKEERRLRTEDDPVATVVEEVYAAAYKVHPYGSPVIGWMSDLDAMTVEALRSYYKLYYSPNNSTVVLVGDVNAEEILPNIREHFGKIPRGPVPPKVLSKEPLQLGERRIHVKKEAQLPFLMVAYHVPNIGHPDEYALEVLEKIVSQGESSRLYRKFVYETQMASYVGGDYARVSADPTLFYFYGGLRPERKVEELERGILEEIERLKREPVNDQELEKAKNQIEAAFIFGRDSNFYQAMQIGILETIGVGYRALESFVPNIRKVTKEDLMRVARTYFTPENRTVGILIPEKKEKSSSGPGF
ncbi:MAG: insulinase family protein [Candidatus Tectomicrobia bacterium]|uniref:Insulinase family protein n=1 Tax=Tectimicrobiota bacterium TaxID=2528274 RepID=A0A932GRN6_UNCTE|nr:insulinase family protein [Candidatus Tectomicrobia bacterium]